MQKFTDKQLILLSSAAAREDSSAELPDHVGKAAAYKVGSSLVSRKLMREVRSKPGMPVWRQNDQKRNISLVITKSGRIAIGVTEDVDQVAMQKANTETGCTAASKVTAECGPRAGSKQAGVLTMLSSGQGATIDAVSKKMGWLPHTTRAVFSGLRKRGFDITRSDDGSSKSLYRIDGENRPAAGD